MNAPRYVVTNGTLYMSQCCGKKVGAKENAYCWKTEQAAASQAAQTNLREKTSAWHVEVVDGFPSLQSFDATTLAVKSMPEFKDMMDTLYGCVHSIGLIKDMIQRCANGLSEQDKIQEDLLHKIEFESGGRGQGAHLCALLRECRKKRRGYKDMLTMLQSVGSTAISNISPDCLEKTQAKLDNRTYATRTDQVF